MFIEISDREAPIFVQERIQERERKREEKKREEKKRRQKRGEGVGKVTRFNGVEHPSE